MESCVKALCLENVAKAWQSQGEASSMADSQLLHLGWCFSLGSGQVFKIRSLFIWQFVLTNHGSHMNDC